MFFFITAQFQTPLLQGNTPPQIPLLGDQGVNSNTDDNETPKDNALVPIHNNYPFGKKGFVIFFSIHVFLIPSTRIICFCDYFVYQSR